VADKAAPEVVWRNSKLRTNYASGLVYEGKLYVIASPSMMNCVDPVTGKTLWQERLKGNYWASPIGADGKVYTVNEAGTAIVLKAGDKPQVLGTSNFGEAIFATPAIADGRIFFRSDKHLYCIGAKAKPDGSAGR
jgi:outer membrane protein assembly factor BamB